MAALNPELDRHPIHLCLAIRYPAKSGFWGLELFLPELDLPNMYTRAACANVDARIVMRFMRRDAG
jgi:hypothetical protein